MNALLPLLGRGLEIAALTALGFSLLLLLKSLLHFTRAGPAVKREILDAYLGYTLFVLLRLTLFVLLIAFWQAWIGTLVYTAAVIALQLPWQPLPAAGAALGGIVLLSAWQFCRHLLYIPSSLLASWQYRYQRLYPLWRLLSPGRLRLAGLLLLIAAGVPLLAALARLLAEGRSGQALWLALAAAVPAAIALLAAWQPEPRPRRPARQDRQRPNVLMIGTDTLRADRVNNPDYPRDLTPTLDRLAQRAAFFDHCFVPLGRTAPSLASLLTGTWPHRHGIRDNFVTDGDTRLPVPGLAERLRERGYHCSALSDWAGADLGKLQLGFEETRTPPDQWNMKYYLRQGPMDLRLYLSLFTHNRFGRRCLPEIHYLASVPMTRLLGRDTRRMLSRYAAEGRPFFLNLFTSTTHVPFGSDYPYYLRYADPDYDGESKFVMTSLRDPMEIIAKQEATEDHFDLPQIINLYDGCVRQFDDELGRILDHLQACGLADNTLVVVYSDHGVDFFENETWGQGNTVLGDDPGARIPLLILDPRRPGGRRIHQIVRSVDLVPTLLDLLDLPPGEVDGVSLAPLLRGEERNLDLPAFQETGIWLGQVPGMHPEHLRYPNLLELLEVADKGTGTLSIKAEYMPRILQAKDRMIRRGRWKLVYLPTRNGPLFQLFDLEQDPRCRQDVAAEHPALFEALKRELLDWLAADPTLESRP
ncbi:sulfatase-like hydrolase/transferase [Thiohalobacter sp. IOR34]|uniref:sulfatase family protein n=1 Tax=Thiohalobacter sp. IOR34 TaxID=3057176 RepID=UPI0025AF44C4|nr:sulfatase-like hydrolase/transferase [Thiohalobacter sp. IOR34]WJW74446.1 sulfatase-like hydrolase/transferase [Thiohalobacter sp. IOR34]